MSEDIFKYESMQDSLSICRYLRALADGMESGTVSFTWKDNALKLSPKGLLQFTIQAKEKGARKKISLKIAWNDHDPDGGASLNIVTDK